MKEDPLVVVGLRYEFYRDGYRKILSLVMLSMALNMLLAYAVYYIAMHPPTPRYFATSVDGQIMAVRPLDDPVYSTADILSWSTNVAITAYTYDYINFRGDLQNVASSFTSDGWGMFLNALKNSRMLDTVMAQKLVMTASPTGAPVIQQQGIVNGRYSWKISIPMLVKLNGATMISQPVQVYMMLQRVALANNPKGIAINSFIVSENNGAF